MISEGVQVTPRSPTEINHQGNQRLLLIINAAFEEENNIRTIKVAVQSESGRRHPKTFMGMLVGKLSTQMNGLASSFQYEVINSMVAGAMGKYALASAEASY